MFANASPRAPTPRRLAATVAGDIAGFSQLMDLNAEDTLARVKRIQHDLIEPSIAYYGGRLLKATGDGFIAVFDNPLEAVRCGIVIQQNMSQWNASLGWDQRIEYRIGINLGDVFDEDEIFGDGVDVEYRLENIADPGEVYISGDIYEQIKDDLACRYELLGGRKVKNIAGPKRIYRVLADGTASGNERKPGHNATVLLLCFGLLAGAGGAGGAVWVMAQQPFGKTRARDASTTAAPRMPHALSSRLDAAHKSAQSAKTSQPAKASQPAQSPQGAKAAQSAQSPQGAKAAQSSQFAQSSTSAQSSQSTKVSQSTQSPPSASAPVTPIPAQPGAASAAPAIKPVALAPTSPPVPAVREPPMNMLRGGSFVMGSSEDPTEKPIHTVTLKPFAISRYPISVREWNACAAAKACSFVAQGKDNAPVTNVSWSDAKQFVSWLAAATHRPYRLPSESEWEYAARGGTQTKYWWGNKFEPGLADCKGCVDVAAAEQPVRVGSYKPNPFGLYDMGGSVDQWVEDCWHGNYSSAPSDGSPWVESGCVSHVIRSGSWQNDAWYVRPSSRDAYDTNVRYPTHGFRVARSLFEGFR